MSNVGLTGYVIYNPDQMPSSAELGSVDMPDGLATSTRGLTLLYGFRDTISALSAIRRVYEADGHEMATVNMRADVGDVPEGRITLEVLPDVRFLHMGRTTQDVENLIIEYWREFLADEGLSGDAVDNAIPYERGIFVTRRPDLIGRLQEKPEFSHLDVITYRVGAAKRGHRQVATLFNRDIVSSVECLEDIDVRLPADFEAVPA